MNSSINGSCYLRKAEIGDINVLFQWVNDSETRHNSFNQHEITWEEHEEWFKALMNDPNRSQYILMDNNVPIGQVRLDFSTDTAQISYSIAPEERGKGYGKHIIRLAKQIVHDNYPFITVMRADVKPQNIVSLKCFEDNGFSEERRVYEINMISSIS